MRTVAATRYVTPLREGGSLPAVVEGDDSGLYVLKFRGAGHGAKALVAEVVAGELMRAAGLRLPEIVLMEVDAALGRNEADPEIRDLLRSSVGLNLGLDFLPGSAGFDPAAGPPPPGDEASAVVWMDAFTHNIDRTARNPNLLWWHGRLWAIDHGAAIVAQHAGLAGAAERPFAAIAEHVLLPVAGSVVEADARLRGRLSRDDLERIVGLVPAAWFANDPADAYVEHLERRLAHSRSLADEAEGARVRRAA